MKRYLLFFAGFVLFFPLSAQEAQLSPAETGPRNGIKINLLAIGLQNASLQYERTFHKNYSFALGFSFAPAVSLPARVTEGDSSGTLKNMEMTGYSFTPEFRIYPGKKQERPAPSGFYLAPYFRYSNLRIRTLFNYKDSVTGNISPYDFNGKISGMGLGLMLGWQFKIVSRLSLDWWVVAVHGGLFDASASIKGDLSTVDKQEFREQMESIEIDFPGVDVTTSVTDTEANFNANGPLVGFRFGLALGFRF